jgi:hypothetical protein
MNFFRYMERIRKRFIVFLMLISSHGLLAQKNDSATTLILVGTRHDGNSKLSYKHLHRLFKSLKPDIIFIEQNSSLFPPCQFKPVFGAQIASFLGIWKVSIERKAVQKYYRRNKKTCIVAYDTTFARNQYLKNYVNNDSRIDAILEKLFREGKMSASDSIEYKYHEDISNEFYSQLEESLVSMNRPDMIKIIASLDSAHRAIFQKLVQKYISDQELKEWSATNLAFWDQRNEFMAVQLLEHIALNPGKKMIVLSGLLHKYPLLQLLTKAKKNLQLSFRIVANLEQFANSGL